MVRLVASVLVASLFAACSSQPDDALRVRDGAEQGATVPVGEPADQSILAVFAEHCHACHGANGANAGNLGNVMDLTALQAKRYLVKGDIAASKLHTRMVDTKQPMPPSGNLPAADIKVVTDWIMNRNETGARQPVSPEAIYAAVAKDFAAQPDKANVRYFHLVNLHNGGAPDEDLESTRKALSKLLNMLSTSPTIKVPTAIDAERLVYRVNLRDYELDRPETLYTFMLKTIFPTLSPALRDKWLPDVEERKVENYYGARFKEILEGKPTTSSFLDPEKHTFKDGLPRPRSAALDAMAKEMREAGQALAASPAARKGYGEIDDAEAADTARRRAEAAPKGVVCSKPAPLLRADWFVAQVTGNLEMRGYYHMSGLDDDTVTLDAALGIDDVEGIIVDNDPNFDPAKWGKDPIIRAGFSNSGVSINHRLIERVGLDYSPGRPLWRGYEFKDKNVYPEHDIFEFAAGPFFEIGFDGEPGFECVTFMSEPYTRVQRTSGAGLTSVRTLRLLDLGLLYPSDPKGFAEPRVVTELKAIKPTPTAVVPAARAARYAELLQEFEGLYGHRDYLRYRLADYLATYGALPIRRGAGELGDQRMLACESPRAVRTFRHESLEYLFLRRNGLQGFVNVGLGAEHLDYKVPNQRALENKEALLIPAFDRPELMVVGAPLSCLSCHTKGYIEKQDMVAEYVAASDHPAVVKDKIKRIHKPFDQFKAQMEKDNTVFREALAKTGVDLAAPEPIVQTYRRWAGNLTLAQVAAEMDLGVVELQSSMRANPKVGKILRELTLSGATMRRSEFERSYYPLMCELHGSCVDAKKPYVIPAQ